MTTELTALAVTAILQVIIILIAGYSLNRDVGADWNVGPRDTEPKLSARTQRLRRAVDNHVENLGLFTVAVVVVTLSGASSGVTAVCAWIFVAARILYVPAYAFGWTPWRSVIFMVGLIATLAMIVAALLRV